MSITKNIYTDALIYEPDVLLNHIQVLLSILIPPVFSETDERSTSQDSRG